MQKGFSKASCSSSSMVSVVSLPAGFRWSHRGLISLSLSVFVSLFPVVCGGCGRGGGGGGGGEPYVGKFW